MYRKQTTQVAIDRETKQELEEAFSLFDLNKTGLINARELKAIMQAFGMEIKKEDIRQIYYDIKKDANKDSINQDEFFNIMIPRLGDKDSDEQIQKMFELFVQKNERGEVLSDQIAFSDLKAIANQLEPQLGEEELHEMFDEADVDQDGYISQKEFFAVMKRKGNTYDDITDDEEY